MSSTHITDELPRLLSGEADRATVLESAAHLRNCVDCQQELVSAVVAHASLASARRFAPEVVGRDRVPASGSGRPLPDLSALFEQVHREASRPAPPVEPAGRSRRRYLVAAAAAVLIAGGAVGYVALSGDSTGSARTVALSAFDKGSSSAVARMSPDGELLIDASSLPQLTGRRYEVWLTDADRTAMQPVGWIAADGTGDIRVPEDLMHRFSDIEVSVQKVDARSYDYSGTSVLRGAYRG
jgi:Anti-sigma-K factor rskA